MRLCQQLRSLTNIFANRMVPKHFVTLRNFPARSSVNPIGVEPFNINYKRTISSLI